MELAALVKLPVIADEDPPEPGDEPETAEAVAAANAADEEN